MPINVDFTLEYCVSLWLCANNPPAQCHVPCEGTLQPAWKIFLAAPVPSVCRLMRGQWCRLVCRSV